MPVLRYLPAVLLASSVALTAFAIGRPAPVFARASSSCRAVAAPPGDVAAVQPFDSATEVVANFDHARATEHCSAKLKLDPLSYGDSSERQQMLTLINAERTARGLKALRLDRSLLSRIALNHSREMITYDYFNHPSPINHPGGYSSVFLRDTVNPAVEGHFSTLAENIAAGYPSAAEAVYAYMYQDSGESWGHRDNILGYQSATRSFGTFDWIGIGIAHGGAMGTYYSDDFLSSGAIPYQPPIHANLLSPAMSPPKIVSGSISKGGKIQIRVRGVADPGEVAGEAGVGSVVFYGDRVTMDSQGKANTVTGREIRAGVWQVTLKHLRSGALIHAVATDGSGNFTDCAVGAPTCGGNSLPSPAPRR